MQIVLKYGHFHFPTFEVFELLLKTVVGDSVVDIIIAPKETQDGRLGWSASVVYCQREQQQMPSSSPERLIISHC